MVTETVTIQRRTSKRHSLSFTMTMVKVEVTVIRSEFYNNLVINLTTFLNSIPSIVDVQLQDRVPQDKMNLALWQQQHDVRLPPDVTNFYLAADGFRLSWSYKLNGVTHPVGLMNIFRLDELICVTDIQLLFANKEECPNDVTFTSIEVANRPFPANSRIIALSTFKEGCVCLIMKGSESHGIWFAEETGNCHLLASNFTTYFRLLLLYQGLPQWPYLCIKKPLNSWPKQLFLNFAPHLLQPWKMPPSLDSGSISYNELDISSFRTKKK